jgi:hypothetical protein
MTGATSRARKESAVANRCRQAEALQQKSPETIFRPNAVIVYNHNIDPAAQNQPVPRRGCGKWRD